MSDDLDPTTDPILQRLRRDRPVAGPSSEVRTQHRQEVHEAMADADRRRRPWLVAAAAAACVAVVGGVVLANGGASDGDRQVATGDENATESSTTAADDVPGAALMSDECGGALPFDVPAPDGFDGPRPGPATGEPAATSSGQLVAHWSDGQTDIEVRWPADATGSETPGVSNDEAPTSTSLVGDASGVPLGEGYATHLTDSDLSLLVPPDRSSSDSYGVTHRAVVSPADRYEIALAAPIPIGATQEDLGQSDAPVRQASAWGEGMCGIVQLTVATAAGGDVLPVAERVYEQLIRPGGAMFPEVPERDLVAERTDAAELQPVTRCNVPDGIDQEPTESTPVEVTDTHPTADEALAAHIETKTIVDEGPFGTPETTYTVPTSGYTAISLPDGSVAYEFPEIVAYFIAEETDGGWAITRYEGPTC